MNESLLAKDIDEKEFSILAMLAKALGNTFNEGTEDLLFGEIAHRKKKGAVITVKDKNHKEQSYVHVPVTTTDESFRKTRQFLDNILVINARKDGQLDNAARRYCKYFALRYPESMIEYLREANYLVVEYMNETKLSAT